MSLKSTEGRTPPQRVLMAPGPSNIHPRVAQALIAPLVGHKDPYFLGLLGETASLLRTVFQTENAATFALPASGGSGMEAALVNALEPGDTVVIAMAGFFAGRMVEICHRFQGVTTIIVEGDWGKPVEHAAMLDAVRQHRPRALAVVHGETSTGVVQPLSGLGDACHEVGALLIVDAVATLGGVNLPVDELGIDICFSGSQKCLSAPPGLAPITLSDRAVRTIAARRSPVQSWYFDLALHAALWGEEHVYHHTSPVLNLYALHEALSIVLEEGLEACFARHWLHSSALAAGLEAMGLCQLAEPAHRMPSVVAAMAPPGISSLVVRSDLLRELNVEVSGGLGEYADRMWRIGVMGHSAQRANVMLVLEGLAQILRRYGHRFEASPTEAAARAYPAT